MKISQDWMEARVQALNDVTPTVREFTLMPPSGAVQRVATEVAAVIVDLMSRGRRAVVRVVLARVAPEVRAVLMVRAVTCARVLWSALIRGVFWSASMSACLP